MVSEIVSGIHDQLPREAFWEGKWVIYPGPYYVAKFSVDRGKVTCSIRTGDKFLRAEFAYSQEDDVESVVSEALDGFRTLIAEKIRYTAERIKDIKELIKVIKPWQVRLDHLLDVLGGEE